MRTLIVGVAFLVLGTAASTAQPYYGYDRPPPPPYGYDRRPPPPPYGYDRRPPPPRYYDDRPRRCFIRDSPYGPRRVCRDDY